MKFVSLVLVLVLFTAQGCTNSDRAGWNGWGKDSKITLFNGGVIVREWKSKGKVQSEAGSDGWYFMDVENGKLVRVSGTVVVEQL